MNTLNLYTDYISNPKSDKWNNGEYPVTISYQAQNMTTQEQKVTVIKVKSLAYAQEIIEFWNACGDGWEYSLIIP